MFQRILLCYDGSEKGRRALRRGAELALFLKARVFVLSVVASGEPDPSLMAGMAGHACVVDCRMSDHQRLMDDSVAWLRGRGAEAEGHLAQGNFVEQIVAQARRVQADLIVLGHYPQPSGGLWWTRGARSTLAEQVSCCILVANEGGIEAAS